MTIDQQLAEIESNAKNVLCPEMLCAMNQKYNELTDEKEKLRNLAINSIMNY